MSSHGRKTREHSGISFIRALIPFMWTLPSWSNHLPKAHLLIPSHYGLEFQHMNLGGFTNIQSRATVNWGKDLENWKKHGILLIYVPLKHLGNCLTLGSLCQVKFDVSSIYKRTNVFYHRSTRCKTSCWFYLLLCWSASWFSIAAITNYYKFSIL